MNFFGPSPFAAPQSSASLKSSKLTNLLYPFETEDNFKSSTIPATTGDPYITDFFDKSYGQDDDYLDSRLSYFAETEALPLWRSEVKTFAAASESAPNETVFEWDYHSNFNNIRHLVQDDIYCTLEDADTGKMLDCIRCNQGLLYGYSGPKTFSVDTNKNTTYKKGYIFNRPLNVHFFLVDDEDGASWIMRDAIRGGFPAILKFYQDECFGGVYAYKENAGSFNPYELTCIDWNITTPDGKPFTGLNRWGTRDFII